MVPPEMYVPGLIMAALAAVDEVVEKDTILLIYGDVVETVAVVVERREKEPKKNLWEYLTF
jgi:hypothetical protein